MKRAILAFCVAVIGAISTFAQTPDTSIEIDLQEQTAYLIRNGRAVLSTPISSGRYGHLTDVGSFKVVDKERNHFSTLYGRIEDARGNTIVADADSDMPVPRGSYRTSMCCSESRDTSGRNTGLLTSYSRCVSQCPGRTTGNPFPEVA